MGQAVPSDAAFLNRWYLTVPVNAAHPNAAKLWVNYLLSRSAQDILWKHELVDYAGVPGSHQAPRVDQLRQKGDKVYDTSLADQQAHAAFEPLETCIQDIINKQTDSSDCNPYRDQIKTAGG